jgi:hypothetical protein
MPAFVMRLKSEQNQLIAFMNEHIIGELRKKYEWLAEDATYVFDEPVVRASENYVFMAYSLVNGGILTPKQAKRYLMNIGILDKKLFEDDDDSIPMSSDAAKKELDKIAVEWMKSGKLGQES